MTTATATTTAAAFEVGQTYSTRSAADHSCKFRFAVVKRTAKFVTVTDGSRVYRVGVKVDEHGEWALPYGTYSMAPVIRANRT